jgi:hypothetical protein
MKNVLRMSYKKIFNLYHRHFNQTALLYFALYTFQLKSCKGYTCYKCELARVSDVWLTLEVALLLYGSRSSLPAHNRELDVAYPLLPHHSDTSGL